MLPREFWPLREELRDDEELDPSDVVRPVLEPVDVVVLELTGTSSPEGDRMTTCG